MLVTNGNISVFMQVFFQWNKLLVSLCHALLYYDYKRDGSKAEGASEYECQLDSNVWM